MNAWLLPDKTPDWAGLARCDWAEAMAETLQDPEYHAEGDVWTHTKMVVSELIQLPDYQLLGADEQLILLASALLHDIAKPITTFTDEFTGRLVSPGHSKVGERMARTLLWDLDFEARERICALVRLHGLPIWALDKENPQAAVIAASLRIPNSWLYLLAKADVLGRIAPTKSEFLDRVELYRELALENGCLDTEKQFLNDHSRFKFFLKGDEFPAELYDDTEFEVVLLSGIAGSGKDTYAASLDLPMISLDDLREELDVEHGDSKGLGHVVNKAYEQAKIYAAKRQSFVWNSTNLTQQLRHRLIRALSVYNPRFRIVYIETSIEQVLARRSSEIPAAHLLKMQRMLEIPLRTEAHQVEYRIRHS